ncbi:MAG: hypothetical protein ACTSQE_15475 [Candidatus Heimdallarchaeaceae archaeon]
MKAPLIWYDILNVLQVLVQFSWLKKDERLLEMLNIVKQKAEPSCTHKAESVWRAWKEWDFR